MSNQYRVIKVDDLTGEEKDVTEVTFKLEGKEYKLDLSPKNKRKLEKALEPFIDAATASSTVRAIRSSERKVVKDEHKQVSHSKGDTMSSRVRKWAATQGIEVPARGRLPKDVVSKFDEYESHREHVG